MESKEKTPRKPRQPRKKRSNQSKADKEKNIEDELEPIFEDALTNFLKRHAGRKGKSLNNIKSLEHLLSQYLNSFILIGYSRDTKDFISIINAHDEQSADSLSTALNKFIMNNTKGPSTGYPPVI